MEAFHFEFGKLLSEEEMTALLLYVERLGGVRDGK